MLPKRRRLSAEEVSDVIARGRSLREGILSMKYLPSSGPLRAAVVAPNSLARKATARNRLRRALYAALASLPEATPFQASKAVFFVRSIPSSPLVSTFREELTLLAKKQQ